MEGGETGVRRVEGAFMSALALGGGSP